MGMDAETLNSGDGKNCPIKLSGYSSSTVYLAGPWSGESGRTLAHRVVQFLREKGIRVVGDIIRSPTPPWNPKRVQRIMGGCTGVVSVLPYRSEGDVTRTSPWILREVDYAIEHGLPLVVFTDDRISIELQIMFWRDEHELYDIVRTWLENKRDLVCRTERREQGNEAADLFAYDEKRRYRSPSIYPLTTFESTIVAAGFAGIAAGAASTAEHLLGYQSGLDLASIVAGLVTLVFASNVGLQVRQFLGQYKFLRWLIPLCGVSALLIAALTGAR